MIPCEENVRVSWRVGLAREMAILRARQTSRCWLYRWRKWTHRRQERALRVLVVSVYRGGQLQSKFERFVRGTTCTGMSHRLANCQERGPDNKPDTNWNHYPHLSPSSTAMASDAAPYTLWCLIKGESTPFDVIAPVHASINRLNLIHEERKNVALRNVDASGLILWML